MKKYAFLLIAGLLFTACGKDPEITDAMLDSGSFMDPSLYDPAKYLVSAAKLTPTPAEAARPVIIAIHGYGATTFEWDEFRAWAGTRTDFSISQVLMGGHGRDYESFKSSTWKDWRQPILDEYEKLEKQGYTNISFAGSSTACTLLLEMLANGYFNAHIKPKHVFLVDPIIVPSDKTLSLVGALGPVIGYITADNTSGEEKYYYHYRPYETLQQLREVINLARKDLEKGIRLPQGCTLKVFKSDKDDVADPVSAVLIYKGVKTSSGAQVDVSMVSSKLHVFTRLDLRETTPTAKDRENQTTAFSEMANTVIQ